MRWFTAAACLALGCAAGANITRALRLDPDLKKFCLEFPGMLFKAYGEGLGQAIAIQSDASSVHHHVHNGGCKDEFAAALDACHAAYREAQQGDAAAAADADHEACVKATAALHKCFVGNREWFKHQFISRLEEGLDQDLKPSPEQVELEWETNYRWWTGMRRN